MGIDLNKMKQKLANAQRASLISGKSQKENIQSVFCRPKMEILFASFGFITM